MSIILEIFVSFRAAFTMKKRKTKKDSILDELSDLEIKRKPRIKYGGLTSSEEDTGRRKTRGKKTTYVDTLGSDSEEVCLFYHYSYIICLCFLHFSILFVLKYVPVTQSKL